MNRGIWIALALAGAALGPAACGDQEAPPEAGPAAGPEAPAGVTASNGRLMLPAVAGNPAAAYFEIVNGSDRNEVIRAVSIEGAGSAMMHTTAGGGMQETLEVTVSAGETKKFEPGGLHVMVGDLADTVVAGGKTEITRTFADGDKVSFPAEVRAAGDAR
jgi:copper(I)-binding protein